MPGDQPIAKKQHSMSLYSSLERKIRSSSPRRGRDFRAREQASQRMQAAADFDFIAATTMETPPGVVGDLDAFDTEVVEALEPAPEPVSETLDVAVPEAAPPALEEDSFLVPPIH